MNLREWLDKEEMGISEFSKIIGYHESTIGRYLLGKMKISRKTANAIEKATGGKVKVSTTLALNPRKSKSKMDKEARDTQKRTEMQLVEEKGEKQMKLLARFLTIFFHKLISKTLNKLLKITRERYLWHKPNL